MLYMRSLFVVRIAVGVGGAGMVYKISASVRREERLVLEEQSELSLERGDKVEVEERIHGNQAGEHRPVERTFERPARVWLGIRSGAFPRGPVDCHIR